MSEKDDKQISNQFTLAYFFEMIANAYSYLHPDYWKRKLLHLVVMIPSVYLVYIWILDGFLGIHFESILAMVLAASLTVVSAFFYPFSLWWYRENFIGQFISNLYFTGSVLFVILKTLLALMAGVAIAGALAPITGPLMLRKCKKKQVMIGDRKDFMFDK